MADLEALRDRVAEEAEHGTAADIIDAQADLIQELEKTLKLANVWPKPEA